MIVTTGGGSAYAERISKSIKYLDGSSQVEIVPYNKVRMFDDFSSENTIIHARAAYPSGYGWMLNLITLEDRGYLVINNTDCLRTTSDKLKCALLLQDKISHPKTWEMEKDSLGGIDFMKIYNESKTEKVIVKPITSMSQGSHVKIFDINDASMDEIDRIILSVPGRRIVVQEFVPYTALHRVVVINGEALPFTFVDRPEWHTDGDWKVSVCLNKTTMQYNKHGDTELLDIAVKAQEIIGGEINFIDIFETSNGYVMGEINTACNLHIHEMLAQAAGESGWNIHRKIAQYLLKRIKEL